VISGSASQPNETVLSVVTMASSPSSALQSAPEPRPHVLALDRSGRTGLRQRAIVIRRASSSGEHIRVRCCSGCGHPGGMKGGEVRLGVDFGRVINDASGHPSGDDTVFLGGTEEEMLETPAMKGSFDALKRLCRVVEGNVWIVSKCGPAVQARTERWLLHHRFFDATGIASDHLRFCRRREEKAFHCRELAITHFVDDRQDVLRHLVGLVPHLFLFGPQRGEPAAPMVPTLTWDDVERQILATL
jgi:hypothetical protein